MVHLSATVTSPLHLADSYDDTQVKYGWSSVSLKEKDMAEFYVDKENLFLKQTSFITGQGNVQSCCLLFT